MTVSKVEFDAANAKGAARLAKTPIAVFARYDRGIGRVVIELSSGFEIAFKPHDAQGLQGAKPDDLAGIESAGNPRRYRRPGRSLVQSHRRGVFTRAKG